MSPRRATNSKGTSFSVPNSRTSIGEFSHSNRAAKGVWQDNDSESEIAADAVQAAATAPRRLAGQDEPPVVFCPDRLALRIQLTEKTGFRERLRIRLKWPGKDEQLAIGAYHEPVARQGKGGSSGVAPDLSVWHDRQWVARSRRECGARLERHPNLVSRKREDQGGPHLLLGYDH